MAQSEDKMADARSWRERSAARDAEEARRRQASREGEASWGITYSPDSRPTPDRLAYEAYERGDRWFQIDLPVNYVQGYAHYGATQTRTYRPDSYDVIGAIEARGWELQHVAATYVERGHASTKRMQVVIGTSADDVAVHGELVAIYVFSRRERAGAGN